jgi:hypothetical protein
MAGLARHAPSDTARWLKERGLESVGGDWYQLGSVRVVVNRTGRVSVMVWHDEHPYSVKLDEGTPRGVLAAVLRAAGIEAARV